MRPSPGGLALCCLVLALATLSLLTGAAPVSASHMDPLVGEGVSTWAVHLQAMDRALERNDVREALRAWHGAYVAARGARSWPGLIEVGDAYLRVGAFLNSPERVKAKVYELYLAALLAAWRQRSVEGAMRAASAFEALGEVEEVGQSLRVARDLGALDAVLAERAGLVVTGWSPRTQHQGTEAPVRPHARPEPPTRASTRAESP